MKVLLIGAGARESALAWKLGQSSLLGKLYLWPGNPGMRFLGDFFDLPASASTDDVLTQARKLGVDLVIVGPEGPLSEGIADRARELHLPLFGPDRQAAQLEASKAFSKSILAAAKIPTAGFTTVTTQQDCRREALQRLNTDGGVVLKASGLAAGKGVFVCRRTSDIDEALRHFYTTDMRDAASTVVIEELMEGRECSYFTMHGSGGKQISLGFAVDYKRLQDGDQGPNTGGMGCYTPVNWLPTDAAEKIDQLVIAPLMRELERQHLEYIGWLYTGLMWTAKGPKVVEFNVRLGDPETQVLAVQDSRDWLLLIAGLLGLKPWPSTIPQLRRDAATVGVVLSSPGYPFGRDEPNFAAALPRPTGALSQLFTASVVASPSGTICPNKGRVCTAVGHGDDFNSARTNAYHLANEIKNSWPQAYFRQDIAKDVQ